MVNDCGTPITGRKLVALRHHASVSGGTLSIVQGGEVFGKVRDGTSGDIYIHDASGLMWWNVGTQQQVEAEAFKRFGHSLAWLQGKLYLVGGVGVHGKDALPSIIEIQLPS